jgi:Tol biopolymer transport system component
MGQMLAAVLIAVAMLSLLAPPAEATFPGRNGDLLIAESTDLHGGPWGTSTLLRIAPDTGAVRRVPVCAMPLSSSGFPGPECFGVGPPAASPDGGSVAFAAADVVNHDPYFGGVTYSLRVLSLATGEVRYVPLAGRAVPYAPIVRWRPDLDFVVVAPRRRVLLAGPDGSDRGRLVAKASAPDVSSSGRLAFVRHRNVHVLKADGTARRLTRKGGDQPSWSPRGKSIAFTRKGWVYTVPAGGGRVRRVTRGFNPVWSPDGKQIAFFRTVPSALNFGRGVTFLHVLDRRSGRVRRVTSDWYVVEDDIPPNGLDWQVAR